MNELLEKIRSSGHWRVLIRPSLFEEERIDNLSTLNHILGKNFVQFRGHSFPFVESSKVASFDGGICQETEEYLFAELWRFYRSGQFIHYSSFIEDRLNQQQEMGVPKNWQPGHFLDPMQVIFRLTEIFEFATRLSFSPVSDGQTHLEISINGIKGRKLQSASGMVIVVPMKLSHIETLPTTYDYSNFELVANNRELAIKAALEIFQPFGWNPSLSLLKDLQTDLLEKSPWAANAR